MPESGPHAPCRLLIVDDSQLYRSALALVFARDASLQVIGEAGDGAAALRLVAELSPDVVVMDLMMPKLNGIETAHAILRDYGQTTSVVLLSALARQPGSPEHREAIAALPVGIVDLYEKPTLVGAIAEASIGALIHRIKNVHAQRKGQRRRSAAARRLPPWTCSVIAVGSSIGGLDALRHILERLASHAPPVVLAQHLAPDSMSRFAAQLQAHIARPVVAVQHSEELRPAHVYVAAQHAHLHLHRHHVSAQPALSHELAASADVLLQSTARSHGSQALGLVLTGMGKDGARGLMALREAGGWTIAQDDRSSLVYGMPRAAAEAGAACEVLPLHEIAERLSLLTATSA